MAIARKRAQCEHERLLDGLHPDTGTDTNTVLTLLERDPATPRQRTIVHEP